MLLFSIDKLFIESIDYGKSNTETRDAKEKTFRSIYFSYIRKIRIIPESKEMEKVRVFIYHQKLNCCQEEMAFRA